MNEVELKDMLQKLINGWYSAPSRDKTEEFADWDWAMASVIYEAEALLDGWQASLF